MALTLYLTKQVAERAQYMRSHYRIDDVAHPKQISNYFAMPGTTVAAMSNYANRLYGLQDGNTFR